MEYGLLYFAYGETLNLKAWLRWLLEHEAFDLPLETLLRVQGPAFLPDYQAAFDISAPGDQGGKMNARRRTGHVLPGCLYKMTGEGYHLLEAWAWCSIPMVHERVTVLNEEGRSFEALTHLTPVESGEPTFFRPTPERLHLIRQGYQDHHLMDVADLENATLARFYQWLLNKKI